MNKAILFNLLLLLVPLSTPLYAQKAARQTQRSNQTGVSVRAQSMFQQNELKSDETRWMREIYRHLDMQKEEKNMPLYYPVEPVNGQGNLFTTVFKLLCDGKLPAYEYLDGRELFDDSTEIKMKDVLEKFHVMYQEKGSGNSATIVVDDTDIPSSEVKGYYLKERYYFDHRTSEYKSEVEALCPILYREGEFGGEAVRYPMFWVKYDAIRPYLVQTRIMTSSVNNAMTQSMEDFFSRKEYKGEIYKTTNLRNVTLMQYCPTPDSLEREQERIELQLTAFEKSLWGDSAKVDSTQIATAGAKDVKGGKSSVRSARGSSRSSASTSTKSSGGSTPKATTSKQSTPKPSSGNSGGAVRSVRRR